MTPLPAHRIDRRSALSGAIALSVLNVPILTTVPATAKDDQLQSWLARKICPIRSVDSADSDFSDLEPIARAIGDARVVQLGEPSHNAGTCFAAKVRLIKFLHRRSGFDVVAWESGIYDVELVEAGLRAGEDPVRAAQRGILRNWSASQECKPLFEYAQRSNATDRPLTMAGFDSSLTSPVANLAAEMRSYVTLLPPSAAGRDAGHAMEEVIARFSSIRRYVEGVDRIHAETPNAKLQEALANWERDAKSLRPDNAMLAGFERSRAELAGILRENERAFAKVTGVRRTGLMRRIVDSLGACAINLYERFGTDVAPATDGGLAEQNRRDAANADNLRWLLEHGFPGKKIIVWAHNAHVMNAYYEAPDWKTVRLSPADSTMKPSGAYLKEWLRRDVYSIGFTAYAGEDGWTGLGAKPIPAARPGSLEDRLRQLNHPYAFLDLQSQQNSANPLRRQLVMRIPKYDENDVLDPTRPYDGIFFIEDMNQANLLPAAR